MHFAASRLVATVPLTRRWSPRIPQKSAITTLQTKSVSPLPFVWQVQKWPSPVRGDIWDRRHKAKALNKNHPFWSQRGQRGERFCCSSGAGRLAGQPASDWQSSFFLPLLHSFYFINLTSPLPFHTSDGTSPRLSLTSPKSHCVWRPTSAAVPSFFFVSLRGWGLSRRTESHKYRRGEGRQLYRHLFLNLTRKIGERGRDPIPLLSLSPTGTEDFEFPSPQKTSTINSSQTRLLLFPRIQDGGW